jgi:hypothetical protein
MQLQEFLNKSSGVLRLPGHEYMIDRLVSKLSNLQHIVLVAHKGWGKSPLIREVGFRLIENKKEIQVFYYDMKWVFDRSTFIKTFIQQLCTSLSISIPDLGNVSQQGFRLLELAESIAKKHCFKLIVFISDFDQISRFNLTFQELKLLRLILIKQRNCAYCISGSNQPFFESLFGKAPSPMSPFGKVFYLKRRLGLNYTSYVKNLFFQSGKRIEHQAAVHLTILTENHYSYINLLSWNAFLHTTSTCNMETVTQAFKNMIVEFQLQLQLQLARLTAKQYFYLCALASDQEKICSREVLEKYKLGRSSNVARIRENLLSKELIELQRERVIIIDPLLKHWLMMEVRSRK